MSYRKTVIKLLGILEREGGYRTPVDQVAIAEARTLVALEETDRPITIVVCNMPLCPSRLELSGTLSKSIAAAECERMAWWTDGEKHVCPSCSSGGALGIGER